MRVGIDSHSAEDEGEGNATYSRNLIAALAAAPGDDEFALLAGDPAHAFYRSLPPDGRARAVAVTQGKGVARLGWALARAAARARVDALHVQYTAPLGYRRPLVVTVHDLGYLHVPESFPAGLRLALRVLVARSVARAARVITDSEFSRRDIAARFGLPPAAIAVIPLAASARFRPVERDQVVECLARHGLRPGFLFSLGRLNRRKNLERLLAAYGRLRASGGAGVPLVIGGKPDYGVDEVLRQARLSADPDSVRFVDFIPDEELPAFFSAAAAFVYPSLFEGFGLPVLEAMACGTPVVASDRAALPELVGNAGLIVDPESVDALAEGMSRLLGDPALARELGDRGIARARRYSWEATARQTLEAYRSAGADPEGRGHGQTGPTPTRS
jgi:glycosyltransferase involved in cell wall biosynthesis